MNSEPGRGDFARFALPLAGLFLIMTFAPFFYTTAMRDIFTLSKALPLSIGAALLWTALAWTGEASFDKSLTPAILAMSAVTLLSACFSVDMPMSLLGPHQQQFYAILPLSLCLLAYYGAANAESVPSTVFVMMALLGGVAVCIPAFSQIGGHGFMAWSIQGGRSGSTFGSPVFLGSYLAILLPLAWVQRGEPGWPRIGSRALLVVIGCGLMTTGSRGSILAAVSGVFLIEYLRNREIAIEVGIFIPAIAAMFFLRYAHSAPHATSSDAGRFETWRIAVMAWRAHPILGWGPDTFTLAFRQFMTQRFVDANKQDIFIQQSAHNDILQVLSTLGVIGLAAYTYLNMRVARLLAKADDPEALGITGAIAALFINAKFNPIPLAVMVIAACLIGCLDRGNPYPEDTMERDRPWAWLAAVASVVIALIFGVMCNAERHQRAGENLNQMGRDFEAAEQFNLAAKINPFDLWYTQRQLDYFWTVIPHMPGVDRDTLAAFSHNISDNISRLHPLDPTAHEMRALSYLFEGEMIGRDRFWEADHELEVAERLAPHFSRYTQRREALHLMMRK